MSMYELKHWNPREIANILQSVKDFDFAHLEPALLKRSRWCLK